MAAAVAVLVTCLLLSHLTTGTTAADQAPSPTPTTGCSTAMILFSPCLSYVSSSPNDLDSSVSPWCCSAYSSVLSSGSSFCLCYLLRQPDLLGYSINNSRLISLSFDCSVLNASFVSRGSLKSLCSASPPLPPLSSSSGGSDIQPPPDTSPASVSSPQTSPPTDCATGSEMAPSIYAPESDNNSPGSTGDFADSSGIERFNTPKRRIRSLLGLGVLANALLLTTIVGHL